MFYIKWGRAIVAKLKSQGISLTLLSHCQTIQREITSKVKRNYRFQQREDNKLLPYQLSQRQYWCNICNWDHSCSWIINNWARILPTFTLKIHHSFPLHRSSLHLFKNRSIAHRWPLRYHSTSIQLWSSSYQKIYVSGKWTLFLGE